MGLFFLKKTGMSLESQKHRTGFDLIYDSWSRFNIDLLTVENICVDIT